MKVCSKCKVPKELKEFDKKGNGLSSHCKECRREYVNSHYNRNKEYYKEKAKKTNRKYSDLYNELKRSLNCTDCGMSFKEHPYLCDFHHLDDKLNNIANLKYSLNLLKEEIDKCIPLCANCHRIRTYSSTNRTSVYETEN